MVLFITGVALLVACNATGQGVETAPLPTSTLVEERASAAAVQLLAATEMSATAEATLSVEAYPPPESPPIEATPSLAVPQAQPPTETPFSYPIYTPLPTATPFPAQPVAAEHLPALTHDLLFIQDATLMRWNYRASRIEALFGPATASRRMPLVHPLAGPGVPEGGGVFGFTISPDARWLIFTHALGPEQSRIVMLNLETLESRVLVEGERLYSPALSSDGRWVIYESMNLRSGDTAPYYIATSGSGEGGPVGDCAAGETPSPHLCREGDNLWVHEGGQRTQIVFQPSCEPNQPLPPGLPNADDWSPSARYRLFTIYGEIEGSAMAVEEIESGWTEEVPDSFNYTGPQSKVIWVAEDRLLNARSALEFWRIEPEGEPRLVLERSFAVGDPMNAAVIAPTEFNDRRLGFALVSTGALGMNPTSGDGAGGLYVMDSIDSEPHLVNNIPLYTYALRWVPDGSGALITETHTNQLLYAPTDGGALYDLRPAIPETAGCFAWVPNP
jgi:hypothetical protein